MDAEPKPHAGQDLAATPDSGRLVLPPELLQELARTAAEAAPEEACGLLVGRRGATPGAADQASEAPRVPNRAADPRVGFELEPGAWAALEAGLQGRGLRVLGTWHSHPRGPAAPSTADLQGALPGSWNLVVTPDGGWQAWRQPLPGPGAGPRPGRASSSPGAGRPSGS